MGEDISTIFSPAQALLLTQNSVKIQFCPEEEKKKHACEKGQYTHKTPPSAPFAIVPDLKHPPHKFQTLFSPVQALVFALHTLKQVSVSYGKTKETWSAPHPYLLQPSSNSRRTTPLCLRPPLTHRTHRITAGSQSHLAPDASSQWHTWARAAP